MILRRPKASSSSRHGKHSNNSVDECNSDNDGKVHATESHNDDAPKIHSLVQRLRIHVSARRPGVIVITLLSFVMVSCVFLLQLHAYVREYQGPLDHVTTSLWEPYYGMFCPDFSSEEDPINNASAKHEDSNNFISWDCAMHIQGATNSLEGKGPPPFPRIYMVGARDDDEDTFQSWQKMLHISDGKNQSSRYMPHLERINTLKMSNQYALSGGKPRQSTDNSNDHGYASSDARASSSVPSKNPKQKQYLCRKLKWEHRLFAVYQKVFSRLLSSFPDEEGFVIIEDDAILKDINAFVSEVCHAHHQELEFYSLYRSPLQVKGKQQLSSCIYLHGTVAFYIRRSIMETIVNEHRRSRFCRFPIDMYISKMGPWYATRREIVGHLDLGRVGSV